MKCHLPFAVVLTAMLYFVNVECRPAIQGNESQIPSIMCKLPAVRGHCRAFLPRWRYDATTGKCAEFNFGGCDGNGNNFVTQKSCMAVCAGV